MTSTIIFSNLFCTGKIIFFRWIRPHLITSQRKLNWQNFFSSLPTLLPPSQASNRLSPYGSPRWPSTKDVCNYKPIYFFFYNNYEVQEQLVMRRMWKIRPFIVFFLTMTTRNTTHSLRTEPPTKKMNWHRSGQIMKL